MQGISRLNARQTSHQPREGRLSWTAVTCVDSLLLAFFQLSQGFANGNVVANYGSICLSRHVQDYK